MTARQRAAMRAIVDRNQPFYDGDVVHPTTRRHGLRPEDRYVIVKATTTSYGSFGSFAEYLIQPVTPDGRRFGKRTRVTAGEISKA